MPLDPTLVRGLTPISMPQRDPNAAINQLGAIMKIQGLQNEMQANQLQAQKYQQDIATGQATERKARLESKIGAFRNGAALAGEDPTALMGLISTAAQDPDMAEALGIGPQHVQFIGSQLNDPAKVSILARRMRGMTAKEEADLTKPSEIVQKMLDAGIDPNSPQGRQIAATALNRDINGSPTEAGRLALDRQKFEYEKNNPGFEIKETPQGLVSVNKRTGEAQAIMLGGAAVESTQSPAFKAEVRTAEKRGELAAQAESDQAARARGAANVLTSLGYNLGNPSADDKVTSLIKKSTGGLLEAGASQIPRVIGQTTPGRLAIAELKTIANNTAMDLLGGKIGAGISNADRDFIIAGLGEIGDPGIPVEERVAAWRQVTARLARIANADKFSPATDRTAPAGGQSAPAQPENDSVSKADALLLKYPGK